MDERKWRISAELNFKNLAESVPQIVWITDGAGLTHYYNSRWYEYTGIDLGNLSPETWRKAIHPEDLPALYREYGMSILEGRAFEFQYRLRRKDGQYRWHLGRTTLVRAPDGSVRQRIGTATDVHDQIEARQKALEFKQRADAIISNTPILLWAVDVNGVFTYYAGKGQEILGIQAKDRIGKNLLEMYSTRPEISWNTRRALNGEVVKGEAQIGNIWLENTFVPLYDEDRRVVGVVGLSLDITERKLRESERKKSDELFHQARWGISVSSAEFKFLQVNPAFIEMHGGTPEYWAGRHVKEIFDPRSKSDFDTRQTVVPPKNYRSHEAVHVRRDGTTFPARVDVAVIKNEAGKVQYHIATITDLTELKKSEAELHRSEKERTESLLAAKMSAEASRVKSAFLANMSHEIRTPINGMVGMAKLLAETQLSGEQREYVRALLDASESLTSVVSDVLDFSKIEAGKLELDRQDFDLIKLIRAAEKTMALVARGRGLKFSLEIPEGMPRYYRGDAARLRQIFNNLINNAVKFTKTGEVCLKGSFEPAREGRVRLHFEIQDTGMGIEDSVRAHLFQPFSQADASTTRKFGGTGLGLSICKHLVEQFGGTIGYRSKVGIGSTFWFTLELESGVADQVPATDFRNVAECLRWTPRVLIAEDNRINQLIAIKLMERMGCKPDAVLNGRLALERLRTTTYDLILMDCQMPELDGYETTRRIRREGSAEVKDIPIIAMTANAISGDREKCLEAGMNDYVAKPFEPEELSHVMLECLSRVGPRRTN